MQNVIQEFERFMGIKGRYYSEFYIGIAADPIDRLTNGHGVNTNIPNVYSTTPMHTDAARAIEKYFLNKGARGGSGGGDSNTQYVYAYKITPQTRQ